MPEEIPANRLAPVPPRTEWFAGIESGHNRRGYLRDVGAFMDHAGLRGPEELRDAAPEQVEDWREALLERPLRPATVRRKLSALSSLFDDLLARGAVEANPVRGVERPADEEGRHAAPVLTGEQARRLLDAPPGGTIKGLRDRAILAVMLYQGLTREELCGLRVDDLVLMDGQPRLKVAGNRGRMRITALHPEAEQRIGDYLRRAGHGRDPSVAALPPGGQQSRRRQARPRARSGLGLQQCGALPRGPRRSHARGRGALRAFAQSDGGRDRAA